MNKLYKILLIFVVALSSCNPMNDTYNLLNKDIQPPQAKFSYTLSNADYVEISSNALADATTAKDTLIAKSIKSTNSLPEGYAATYVPALLTSMYPALGKGSSSMVSYNFNLGSNEYSEEYTMADQYKLANTDYPKASDNAIGFYPSENPSDYLGNILSSKISDPVEGQIVFVKYNQYTTEPVVGMSDYFNVDFTDGTLGSFNSISVVGDQVWGGSNYGAKMSGYVSASSTSFQNEDWLISPAIDLTSQSNPIFQVDQVINKGTDMGLLNVMVSADYTAGADPSTATWDKITLTNVPDGTSWTDFLSDPYDLAAYTGKTIHFAFKYESTTTDAATWEILSAAIKVPGVTGDIASHDVYYKYTGGAWVPAQGVYALNSEDYNSMGAPGKYDNFSSSELPENYLPQFLANKYPYAQEGMQLVVVYKYYSKGTQTRADQYTFTNSTWVNYNPVEMKTGQFINTGTKWVFDPTVTFTMATADYQLIVDAVKDNPNLKQYLDSYGTAEFYYGASAYYSEFNAQTSNRTDPAFTGLSDADVAALITQRIQQGIIVMLKAKFPNAVAQVSGINVMYVVSYIIYGNDGSTAQITSTFQCTKSAPNPEFTFVSSPTASK